jgi:predicted HicB family RNase H-like nuclease
MQYRGYTGVLEVDEEADILYGHVVGLRDVITFQGKTVEQAREEFRRSVDSYLEFCASRGEPPEKPFSGKFLVRIDPALHRSLASAAEARGTSLNALVEQALANAVAGPSRSSSRKRR